MADEEAEQDRSPENSHSEAIPTLQLRLTELQEILVKNSEESPDQSSTEYCQELCRIFVEYAGRWNADEEPLPLLEVYVVALLSYTQASCYLSLQCENAPLVIERLSLSFVELLLTLKEDAIPEDVWKYVQQSVKTAHIKLQENGIGQLGILSLLGQYDGVWTNTVLQGILSNERPSHEEVEEFLRQEGPVLLQMRVKQLMKHLKMDKAALLAKTCADCPAFQERTHFKSLYLVALCSTTDQEGLMEEIEKEDCQNALEMICNLESEGDEASALSLCSAFLTRQLLQGDAYCAWELTLFWSKLLKRLVPSEQSFLEKCRQMSLLTKSVFHILFLIKVVQSEMESVGLPVCIEMCIRALQMESIDGNTKATVCKTISCLLPTDLEVKRACQLTEFLLEPTVDSYYAVETLYNEPDAKLDEENMPVPNSLRCELLLVFKTQWPFDPEFWDWKTLKRQCLALMGEEASIVSSIDLLNDEPEEEEVEFSSYGDMKEAMENMVSGTYDLNDVTDGKEKKREMKKLREKGFISARFRNWQAYMQYCVLCDKEFLGHRIVRHAQTHVIGGEYTCPICAQTFPSKETLLPHVTSHVKASCKERLGAVKAHKKLTKPSLTKSVTASSNFKSESNYHENGGSQKMDTLLQPQRYKMDINEINVCPVGDCKRSFKFFKNLIAHVKTHVNDEEASSFLEMHKKKVVCQYCRRHFINVTHLNDHLQVHCGVKPYICIQLNCKASFESNNELYAHRKIHTVFKAKCMFPKCGKVFNEAFKLYNHEACHYKTFTCNVADCGKVFHSQQQLEVHVLRHTMRDTTSAKKDLQTPEPGPSLIKQMLTARPQPDNLKTEMAEERRELPNADESLLKFAPNIGHHIKPELLDYPVTTNPMQGSLSAVIQPLNSHSSETSVHREFAACPSANYAMIPQASVHPHPSHTNSNMQHNYFTSASPNQPQTFMNSNATNPSVYNTNVRRISPAPSVTMCNSNVLRAAAASQRSQQPALSQTLPPTGLLTAQTQAAIRPQMSSSFSSTAPVTVQKERFHCAFQTCFKHYSSHKNVIKHMKSSHSDFYEQWKLSRSKIKTTFVMVTIPSPGQVGSVLNQQGNMLGPGVQRQNVIQSPSYSNFAASSSHSNQPLYNQSHNQATSMLMNTIKGRTVPPQCRIDTNVGPADVKVEDGAEWNSVNQNDQIEKTSQVYSSNIQGLLQVDSNSCTLAPSAISSTATGSGNVNVLQPPTNPIAPCSSQMKSDSDSAIRPGNNGLTQNQHQPRIPSVIQKDEGGIHQLMSDSFSPQNDPDYHNRVKRSKRSKWPAILKDGKFLCCRCFREFNSTKSLGGHLSKRSSCKPYDESQLNADLPSSFLDLLNSEPPMNPLSYAPSSSYQNKNDPLLPRGSIDPKPFTPVSDSADKMTDCDKGQSTEDILKQIMRDSNMANPFLPTSTTQQCFQMPSVSYGVSERLPVNSVIQHTENIQPKRNSSLFSKTVCQQSVKTFTTGEFPDMHLSRAKTERNMSDGPFVNHAEIASARMTQRETCGFGNASQTPGTAINPLELAGLRDSQAGPTMTWGSQGVSHIKTEEPDVRERLREQILSGAFQQRSRLPDTNVADTNFSFTPVSTSSGLLVSQISCDSEAGTPIKTIPERSPNTSFVPRNDLCNSFLNQVSSDDSTLTASSTDLDSNPKFPFLSLSTPNSFFHSQTAQNEKTCEAVSKDPNGITNSPFVPENGFTSNFLGQMACVDNDFPAITTEANITNQHISVSNSSNPLLKQLVSNDTSCTSREKACSFPVNLEQLLGTESFSAFRESRAPMQELLSPAGNVSMDADTEPVQLSSSQLQCMSEIQNAFERLNLLREFTDGSPSCRKTAGHDQEYLDHGANKSQSPVKPVPLKPFVCNNGNCSFGTISGESFWKHLSKSHNYTLDMINEIKRKNGLYAPFKCLKCSKTYTRNSNLRVHYQSYHKLSANEITELDTRRRNTKTAELVALQSQLVSSVNLSKALNAEHSTNIKPEPNSFHNEVKPEHQQRAILPHSSMDVNKPNSLNDGFPSDGLATLHPTTSNTSMSTFNSTQSGPVTELWANRQRLLPSIQQQYTSRPQLENNLSSVSGPRPPTVPFHSPAPKSWLSDNSCTNKPNVPFKKKAKEKRSISDDDANNPYRPYRCVHQGCVAAFTIQQNLILHYKAVHQSALTALEVNEEQEQNDPSDAMMELEDENDEGLEIDMPLITEMRCQVKDCSRVFQDGSSLLQHYTRLHEFGVERVSRFFSTIRNGKFECGYLACKATFSSYWPYIAHVKEQHKDFKIRNHESLNGSFKCEIEGCDRRYTTKSNMLRHVMKIHPKFYQGKSQIIKDEGIKKNPSSFHPQITKTSNGKENIETNKKLPQKMRDVKKGKKDVSHWTTYGKPALKSKVEAAAICDKPFALQYPCMLKGCEAVMKSEKRILKHYMGHGLSEKYLEQQRSGFIFCKKSPKFKSRPQRNEESKSENGSEMSDNDYQTDEASEDGAMVDGYSKPLLRRRIPSTSEIQIPVEVKVEDEVQEVVKRKRGRPRKIKRTNEKKKKMSHPLNDQMDPHKQPSCSSVSLTEMVTGPTPLASFKPMGFEMSFLQFLEQTNKPEVPLVAKVALTDVCKRVPGLFTKDTCVLFRNPQDLKSLGNVRVIIDKAYFGASHKVLKQLQDMHPKVVLKRTSSLKLLNETELR